MSRRTTAKSIRGLEQRKHFITLNIEFIYSKAIFKHKNAQETIWSSCIFQVLTK